VNAPIRYTKTDLRRQTVPHPVTTASDSDRDRAEAEALLLGEIPSAPPTAERLASDRSEAEDAPPRPS
jgi:hypothetical protein